jgi:uncharacterized membrane protein
MINELLFFLSLVILVIVLLSRHKIVEYLDENYYIEIQSEQIVYVLSFLFMTLIITGMLYDGTNEKYNQISQNYNNMRPKVDNSSLSIFDINFDIFK